MEATIQYMEHMVYIDAYVYMYIYIYIKIQQILFNLFNTTDCSFLKGHSRGLESTRKPAYVEYVRILKMFIIVAGSYSS